MNEIEVTFMPVYADYMSIQLKTDKLLNRCFSNLYVFT